MKTKTYGSEYHFFRYRREHPAVLDAAIRRALQTSNGPIEWIYPKDPTVPASEPEGLGFIPDATRAWKDFWPTTGSQQCWDGVAREDVDAQGLTWLLMEAKANQPEFTGAPCGAKIGSTSRAKIEAALGKVKHRLGVHRDFSWTGSYYQYANRLAALWFLVEQGISAHLLFIYFTGDCFPDGRPCPASVSSWHELLRARDLTLGMPPKHCLSDRIHKIFLPATEA